MTDLSEEQAEELLRQFSETRANMHSFFTNVVKAIDTTKTGNLKEEELGLSKLPVRTYKELELFSREVLHQTRWGDYFEQMSEIQTSTSLSKEAMLLKLAVTTKKELADMTPKQRKKNRGWFKGKEGEDQQVV